MSDKDYWCTRCNTRTDNTGKTRACYCTTYFEGQHEPLPLYWTRDTMETFSVVEVVVYNVRAENMERAIEKVVGEDFDPNDGKVVEDTETLKVMSYDEWRQYRHITDDTRFLY